jgi:PAS domain S-box-containing protein
MESGFEEPAHVSANGSPGLTGSDVPGNCDDSWLRLLGRISPVAIYRGDAEGRCLYVNERWCELTGLPLERALGFGWAQALHPDDTQAVADEWVRSCQLGIPFRMEYRYRRTDGSILWIFGQGVEERDVHGRLTGYIGTATDITEMRQLREALQRSHAELEERVQERTTQWEHMAMIVAASADAIVSSDMTGAIVSWNRAAEKIFGYSSEEMIGRTSLVVTPVDRVAEANALKEQVRRGERVDYLETVRVARSGELIEVGISIFPLRDPGGEVIGTSAIVRDIREQKKTERRLHQLSGRLLRLQDEERRRLARELHDSTAQSLAALAINLSVLNSATDMPVEKRSVLLADGLALAQNIERELRTHTYLLHPPLLDERGLLAALGWFVEGFATRSGVAVDLDIEEEIGRLPERVELTIFRVVQECLANVHRHAKSPVVIVQLRKEAGVIALEVRDAGVGFSKEVIDGAGVGIAGMRERLAQIGGSLAIESNAAGTAVHVKIPIYE